MYEVAPSTGGDAAKVSVSARLYDNWLLELTLTSADASNPYSMYVSFQGDPSEQLVTGWTNGHTEQTARDVTWHLVQVTPGRGFIGD